LVTCSAPDRSTGDVTEIKLCRNYSSICAAATGLPKDFFEYFTVHCPDCPKSNDPTYEADIPGYELELHTTQFTHSKVSYKDFCSGLILALEIRQMDIPRPDIKAKKTKLRRVVFGTGLLVIFVVVAVLLRRMQTQPHR
jgi:hypothetical protein